MLTNLTDISYYKLLHYVLDTPPPLRYHRKRAAGNVARKQQRRARQTGPNGMDKRINPEALTMAKMLEDACDVFLREASRSYLRILEEFGIMP